jgi:hypothetical protein
MAKSNEFEYTPNFHRLDIDGEELANTGGPGESDMSMSAEYPPALPAGMQVRDQSAAVAGLNDAQNKHVRNGGSSPYRNRWTRDDHTDWIAEGLGVFDEPADYGDSGGYGLGPSFNPDDMTTHEMVANDVLDLWDGHDAIESYNPGRVYESGMGHTIEEREYPGGIDPRRKHADWDDFEPFSPNVDRYPGNVDNPRWGYVVNGPGFGHGSHIDPDHEDLDQIKDEINSMAYDKASEITGKVFDVGRNIDRLTRERGMRPGSVPSGSLVRDAEEDAR